MKTSTFNTGNETEAIALVKYFNECGIPASRKGVIVKAGGDPDMLSYLYGKFVTIALI